ncbi:hypothetical protein HPB51_025831 [Rhipicephalus microplus]|uniref:Uncharacterized protein n=1 Tax=Rhipicephalus microplus TaxID=6941 RepID=A0A9J6F9A4_RHIMP|nr:hypothetical protein HPB51_025831 [Rhipicephalus microplus]
MGPQHVQSVAFRENGTVVPLLLEKALRVRVYVTIRAAPARLVSRLAHWLLYCSGAFMLMRVCALCQVSCVQRSAFKFGWESLHVDCVYAYDDEERALCRDEDSLVNIFWLLCVKMSAVPRGGSSSSGDARYSTGYLHSVEGDLADHELLQCIESSVSVVSAVRITKTVTLRFAGTVPSEHESLFKLRCRARPDCSACSVAALVMQQPPAANTPICRKWQEARKLATILAFSSVPLFRRAVRVMAQEENHRQLTGPPASAATRTYALAASSAPRPVPTPARQQAKARLVPPSTESNASPVTPAVVLSAEAAP